MGPTNCIAVRPCKPKFLLRTPLKMCPHGGLGSLCSPIWRLMTWFFTAWQNLEHGPSLKPHSLFCPLKPHSLFCLYFFCTLFFDQNFFIIIPSMGKFSQQCTHLAGKWWSLVDWTKIWGLLSLWQIFDLKEPTI